MDQLGHFRILSRIGVGGMGEVYRARDENLQRDVAVKVLHPERVADATARLRLVREARAAAALNHPHICTIHEVGEAEGRAYIAMECLDGVPLDVRLKDGALPASEVIRYGVQLADALAHAHERNIIHRDLKPGNAIITSDGRLKVLDFGLATRVVDAESPEAMTTDLMTGAGTLAGTPAYMAPEQFQGVPADARSDIWSLGVMLYEMAAGRRPFTGKTWPELSAAILTTSPAPLPLTVSGELRTIIERCLAQHPGSRYQRAGEIRAALETIHRRVATTRPGNPFEPRLRRRLVAAIAAIFVLMAVAVAIRLGRPQAASPSRAKEVMAPAKISIRELPSPSQSNDIQSISSDGNKALFIDYTKGQNLAIADLKTGESRLLTTFDWDHSWVDGGIWSPDGNQIAYTQGGFKADSVAVSRISNLRGEARTFFREGAVPVGWLPDGKKIVATLERADKTVTLGLISIADGSFTPLRSMSRERRDVPALSPDGRFVAYVEQASALRDVHVVSVDGKQERRVTDHPADDYSPVWAPDGKHLAFISNRLAGEALWTIAMEGGEPRGEPAKLMDGMEGFTLVGWTSRGIIGKQSIVTRDVYTIDMDPAIGTSRGTPRPVRYKRSGLNFSPVWSPDGKHLAFISSSRSEAATRYVAVISRAGGESREFLIPTMSDSYDPSNPTPKDLQWFGNGKGLGFSAKDANGRPAAFRLNLDAGDWKTYSLGVRSWTRAAWNHDGNAFCYVRHLEPNGGIFERRIDGKPERRLYALPGDMTVVRDLEFSLDGQWLAFSHWTVEQGGLELKDVKAVNVTSREVRTLASITAETSQSAATLTFSGWAPDGGVVIQRRAGGKAPTEWFVVPLDGGKPRPLHVEIRSTIGKWSPDGSAMAFVQTGFAHGVFIIENPLAGLAHVRTSQLP